MPRNILCAPNLFKFARLPSCTFAICIYLKQFLQCDRAISTIHFKNLYNILSISTLFYNVHNPNNFNRSLCRFPHIDNLLFTSIRTTGSIEKRINLN